MRFWKSELQQCCAIGRAYRTKSARRGHSPSDIQIARQQRILFDEPPARFRILSHQNTENAVGLVQVEIELFGILLVFGERNEQKRAMGWMALKMVW